VPHRPTTVREDHRDDPHQDHREDHRDLASGLVLRSAPGYPAFPVRLADELFGRAAEHLPTDRPATLWDPLCGSGYLATVLGLRHRRRLESVLCTDVAPDAVALAGRNLALLTAGGLAERERELRARAAEFDKPGYLEAARAAARLAAALRAAGGDLPGHAAVADAFDPAALRGRSPADPTRPPSRPVVVVTDVPYGEQTGWLGAAPPADRALPEFVRSLCSVLPGHAVLALCARGRKVSLGPGVPVLARLRLGTRAALIGRAAELGAALGAAS
jgi:23S rRNA (guanine2535-N1)-methyltransferase